MEILNNGATFGEQRQKINNNFTELDEGKQDAEIGKSLVSELEIAKLLTVEEGAEKNVPFTGLATEQFVNDGLLLKVDKESGKSLILNTEITRLASVTNQPVLIAGDNISIDPETKVISATASGGSGSLWTEDGSYEAFGTLVIRKILGYYGGVGAVPTELSANIGKYNAKLGGYTSVKADATTFSGGTVDAPIVVGKNKFNKNDVVQGQLDIGGVVTPFAGLIVANYIAVKPNTTYTYSINNEDFLQGVGYRRSEYTADKAHVSTTPAPNYVKSYTFTTSANTYFIRSTHLEIYKGDIQLEEGSLATRFEQWYFAIRNINGNPIRWSDKDLYTKSEIDELNKPLVSIPKVIYATVGLEFNMYYDQFIFTSEYGKNIPDVLIRVVSPVGLTNLRSFTFTPKVANIGSHEVTFIIYNKNGKKAHVSTHTLIISAATALTGTAKKLVMFGDSNTDRNFVMGSPVSEQVRANLATIGGSTPVFCGTHGMNPFKNEGRDGGSLTTYSTGVLGTRVNFSGLSSLYPLSKDLETYAEYKDTDGFVYSTLNGFVVNSDGTGYFNNGRTLVATYPKVITKFTGAAGMPTTITLESEVKHTGGVMSILKNNDGIGDLDFSFYRQKYLRLGASEFIDIYTFDLGINDANNYNLEPSDIYNSFKKAAESLYDAAIVDNPNAKVVFILPKSNGSGSMAKTDNAGYRIRHFAVKKAILDTFDSNPLRPNGYISTAGLGVDRWYGYVKGEVAVGARYVGITETKVIDALHPNTQGYYQHSDGIASVINYLSRL